jgi:hypothetical protein
MNPKLDLKRPYVCPRCGGVLAVAESWRVPLNVPVDPVTGLLQRPPDVLAILNPPDPGIYRLDSRLECADPHCGNHPRRFWIAEREQSGERSVNQPHLEWSYRKPAGIG